MANAGLFKEQIQIYREVKVQNDFGELVSQLQLVYTTMAKVQHLSGTRTVINSEIQFPYHKNFVIRMYVPIQDDDQILYHGKYYRVTSIDPDPELWQKLVTTEIVNE